MARLIALFADFGSEGPYLGQMQARLLAAAPAIPVLTLQSDAPAMNPRAAAYLLAALAERMPAGTVFVTVVDPGVGSERRALVVQADGRWFVGPDNGLLAPVAKQARDCGVWCIDWQPERLSASFHGRDLFAPVAAHIALGRAVPGNSLGAGEMVGADWPADLAEIVYIDHYGNAYTGVRAATVAHEAVLVTGGRRIPHARVFGAVPIGEPFWYANSSGLVEIAVNQARADRLLELQIGLPFRFD